MLEQLKETLANIRHAREEELKRFQMVCDNKKEFVSKRKSELWLELPFKTDPVSLNSARAAASLETQESREQFLGSEGKYVVEDLKTEIVVKRVRSKPSRKAIILLKDWIYDAESATVQARRTVWNLLRESRAIQTLFISEKNPKGLFDLVSAEDLVYILSRQRIEQVIKSIPDVSHGTKSTYLSHANSLLDYLSRGVPVTAVLTGRRSRLSVDAVAALFDYLETRALKSTTIRAFQDIVLVRALFYAPIKGSAFFDLHLSYEQSVIRLDASLYPVPKSFVELCCCLQSKDRLFEHRFDEKQLNKKLRRLGRYAGLSEVLTPSTLLLFAQHVWFHLLVDDRTRAHLPRR